MGSEIIIGIITAASALLGVLITQIYETIKRKSEEKRWYADYFLNRKIDSITNLHSSLMDWYFSIHRYGNYSPSTFTEFNSQVNYREEAYVRSLASVSIYLDKKEYLTLTKVLGAFRQASTAIWLSLPDDQCKAVKESYGPEIKNIIWEKVEEVYIEAGTMIKEHLNPEILKQVPLDQKKMLKD